MAYSARMRLERLLLAALILAACSDAPVTSDAGTDAGAGARDAGLDAAAPIDGGAARDAGAADSGRDAGSSGDAGTDAGVAPPRTVRVSVATDGTEGDGSSGDLPTISGDGRFVAFTSGSTNLVPGDTNDASDTFLHDVVLGITTRISVSATGEQGDGASSVGFISDDGAWVNFTSSASNLVAGAITADQVYLRNLATGAIERVSRAEGSGAPASASAGAGGVASGGQRVVFYSSAANLVAGDTNSTYDAFLRDRAAGSTRRLSVSGTGTQANADTIGATISADGRFAAFASNASNLVAGDTNGVRDVFVVDLEAGGITRVSVSSTGEQGDGVSAVPSLSADGRFVAFLSYASNLVAGDTNAASDAFVHDRTTGVTTRVSVGTGGEEPDGDCENPKLSADGRYVLFVSRATNLVAGDENAQADAFVFDRDTGLTQRVSVSALGEEGSGRVGYASLSADGTTVTFSSDAPDLVEGDTNGQPDVFVHRLRW